MSKASPYPSIAALGLELGVAATSHLKHAFRRLCRGPRVVDEPRFVRLITGELHPLGNFAVVYHPADLEGTEAAVDPLLHCGAPASVLFTAPLATGVEPWLARAGFESHGALPAMAVEIDTLAATDLPAGYSFTRIPSGPEGDAWVDAFSIGYELPHGVGEAFSPNGVGATTAVDAPLQYFAVRKGGKLVCTSVLCLDAGVAGIYCVATVPEERGIGLGAHATAEPLRLVRALGFGVGVLQSSPAGHSLYRKLGFADVGAVPFYVKLPS
jgi:hypothetical protein